MAEILTPNGADLQPRRRPEVDSLEPPRDDVDIDNTRERMAENQAGDRVTRRVNNEGRRQRMTETLLRRSNTPEEDRELAEDAAGERQERREEALIDEAGARRERRENILESTISSTDELIEFLNHNDLTYEQWLERRALGDEVLDQNDNGFLGRIRAFSRNFHRFLDGEFDVERGQTDLDRDLFRRNYTNEIMRRGLKALFNRRNAVGGALTLGVGLLTGGVAPVVLASLAGMVGGRLVSEGMSVAQGREARARQTLMKEQYREFESQTDHAHNAADESLPLDQRERWAQDLVGEFYTNSEKITSARNNVAEIRDNENRRSNLFSFFGSIGTMAAGAGISFLRAGAEGVYRFMGALDVDLNFVHHQVTTRGGEGLQFIYNAADNARHLIQSGAIKEWFTFGGGEIGHALGATSAEVGRAIAIKMGELALAGGLGSFLAGLTKRSEKQIVADQMERENKQNNPKKEELLQKFNRDINLSHEQESLSYVEATAEQLGKSIPQEGELWIIQDPDYHFALMDDLGNHYAEGDGAMFLVTHVNPNNTAELVFYNAHERVMYPDHRVTVPLIDMVQHMNADPVSNHETNDARHNLEDWLRSMELEGHLVKQEDQPGERKRTHIGELKGAIIDFTLGPGEAFTTLNGRNIVESSKYKLARIDFEPFSPRARVTLVDMNHVTPNGDHESIVISSEDLMRYGRRAYLPGNAPKEPGPSGSKGEGKGPDGNEEKPKEEKKETSMTSEEAKKSAETKLLNNPIEVTLKKVKDKQGNDRPRFDRFKFVEGDKFYEYSVWAEQSDEQAVKTALGNNDTVELKVDVVRIDKDKKDNPVLRVKLAQEKKEPTTPKQPDTEDDDDEDGRSTPEEETTSQAEIKSSQNIESLLEPKTGLETKETYESSLDKAIEVLKNTEGIVELDKDKSTVVIPDVHARREMIVTILNQRIQSGERFIDLLQQNRLNLVLLGDALHSEARGAQRWREAETLYLANNRSEAFRILDQEMAEGLNTIKLIMDLKAQFPNSVHYLRGNHDEINGGFLKFARMAGESTLVREWIVERFGQEFLDKYAQFEDNLPLLAIGDGFVASHSAPSSQFTREQITGRENIVTGSDPDPNNFTSKNQGKGGLTWTDNTEFGYTDSAIDQTLANVGATNSTWVIGHRHVSPGENGGRYRSQFNGKLVQINNPDETIYGFFNPGQKINPETQIYKV